MKYTKTFAIDKNERVMEDTSPREVSLKGVEFHVIILCYKA